MMNKTITSLSGELSNYDSFCFRGEGLSSFVLGATCGKTQKRLVWRFRKEKSSQMFSLSSDAENTVKYIEQLILPLLGNQRHFVSIPKVVIFKAGDLQHLAKLPHFNAKNYSFHQLMNLCSRSSYFPDSYNPTLSIPALQMTDLTSLPDITGDSPVITVEIKPKQGFVWTAPFTGVPYCYNCLMQMEKCKSGVYEKLYDFCSLDLYSGDFDRMKFALKSLIETPNNNLRLFSEGLLVFGKDNVLSGKILEQMIFREAQATLDDFVEVLCRLLTGSMAMNEPFYLRPDSVLGALLTAQKIDKIGIVKAWEIYENLPDDLKVLFKNPFCILDPAMSHLCPELISYLLSATVKDCSIMITMKMVTDISTDENYAFISIPNCSAKFAYRISVIDLDVKPVKKLEVNSKRLMTGVNVAKLYKENYGQFRKPCF